MREKTVDEIREEIRGRISDYIIFKSQEDRMSDSSIGRCDRFEGAIGALKDLLAAIDGKEEK